MTSLLQHSDMKKSPVAAPKEVDITLAAEEILQFGGDNLRGKNKQWCKAHKSQRLIQLKKALKHKACLGVLLPPALETKWTEVPS